MIKNLKHVALVTEFCFVLFKSRERGWQFLSYLNLVIPTILTRKTSL
jgi:hypothetical protein